MLVDPNDINAMSGNKSIRIAENDLIGGLRWEFGLVAMM
jgi:hypothetical protein